MSSLAAIMALALWRFFLPSDPKLQGLHHQWLEIYHQIPAI